MKPKSVAKRIIDYSIDGVDRYGGKLRLGECFRSESEVRAAMRVFSREPGLRKLTNELSQNDDRLSGSDVLTITN